MVEVDSGRVKRKKILMIVPSLAHGGAERVVANLSLYLVEKYDITFLLDYHCAEYEYRGDIEYVSSETQELRGLGQLLLYIKKYKILKQYKRSGKFSYYISHSQISNILNVCSKRKGSISIIVIHSNIFREREKNVIDRIEDVLIRRLYPKADGVVCVSREEKTEIIKRFRITPQKVVHIWNGSNIEKIEAMSKEQVNYEQKKWFSSNEYVFVNMGRYVNEKGQWHLIRAFAEVKKRYSKAKLLLLGEGYLRGYLSQIIDELGMSDNVILCGNQSNPFSVIARSNAFVFSSISEACPCALQEAMCCGVPCISTDCLYGARELFDIDYAPSDEAVTGLYGILTPRCSGIKYQAVDPLERAEKILAEKMIFIIMHPEQGMEMVQNSRERIKLFTLETMVEAWMRMLERYE